MKITPDILLQAYAVGVFPMAEDAAATELLWFDPPERGLIPLDHKFHIPTRLARKIKQRPFDIRFDMAFEKVVRACAAPGPKRQTTWINEEIVALYKALYDLGHAHSVEAWAEGKLVGGLYGVSLGAAFFGESMFSTATDASKIALVHLVEHLRHGGFHLLDAQFLTDHLAQFGAIEISSQSYKKLLNEALARKATFS